MKIVIPTYKRADNLRTLATLHPVFHKDVVLVVRPEEVEAYSVHSVELDVLPASITTLGETRQYIWDKYKHLYRWLLMDDDITGFHSCTGDTFKQTPLEDQQTMFRDLEVLLTADVGCISPRPSWQIPHGNRFPIHRAAPITGFYMFNGAVLSTLNLRFDRFNWAGDADFAFQVLSNGLDCQFLCTYKYSITVASASYQDDEFIRLAEVWPKYIKPRTKKRFHYSIAEAGPRAFTFYWARCLKDAR